MFLRIVQIIFLFTAQWSHAAVYGPSVQALEFSIEGEFSFIPKGGENWLDMASDHLNFTFGVFQSPIFISRFELDAHKIGGIGAIRLPANFKRISDNRTSVGRRKIRYKATGEILVHKKVANVLLRSGGVEIPLPANLDEFYDETCTDAHYNSVDDFWYFHDVYRRGCEYLSRPPYAAPTFFKIVGKAKQPKDLAVRLDLLRGSNGNGKTFRMDVIHGFDESGWDPEDNGRREFARFHDYLTESGFSKESESRHFNRPLWVFKKTMELAGQSVDVEIHSLLVNSSADSRTVTFAKFFREAVEEADVIFYAGHSGLGGNLDIQLLEDKVGGFKFDKRKRQIFYFDSCASYSYYLDHFRKEKTEKSIDVISNGLSSYFETGSATLQTFVEEILDPKVEDKTWSEVLSAVEAQLDGGSYLVNVGGI